MYPGVTPSFGTFIKSIKDGLELYNVKVDLIVISERHDSNLKKLLTYAIFYLKILFRNLDKYDFVHISYPSHTFLPFLF